MFNITRKNRQTEALHAALDAAAPNKELWLAGLDAFDDARASRMSVDNSLTAALDAAAPDEESWIAGRAAFYALYNNRTMSQRWDTYSERAFSTNQQAARQPHTEGTNR